MNKLIKKVAEDTGFTLIDSPIWKIKSNEFAEAMVIDCINQIEDLRGYSGVGEDGNPYDTPSWNAALIEVQNLLRQRFEIK